MNQPYYRIQFKDGLSCRLPDSWEYAMEFARLMILCQRQPVALIRFLPKRKASLIVATYDNDVKPTII